MVDELNLEQVEKKRLYSSDGKSEQVMDERRHKTTFGSIFSAVLPLERICCYVVIKEEIFRRKSFIILNFK